MTTFGLVHGSWHGAWCWKRLVPELEKAGYRAIAVDLPSDDPSVGLTDYANEVANQLAKIDDEIILVGHSTGGLTIPLVQLGQPIKRLIFLSALMPEHGKSPYKQLEDEPGMFLPYNGTKINAAGLSFWEDLKKAKHFLYHDCTPVDAYWAVKNLRPQALKPFEQLCPDDMSIPGESAYILCKDDRIVNPKWSRKVSKEILKVNPIEINGGHSPFLSRPHQLAEILISLAV